MGSPSASPVPDQRFPRAARVRRRRDFVRAQRRGRRIGLAHFVALLARSPAEPDTGIRPRTARLGIVASRRVGPAVVRNRIKRQLREWFRRRRSELPGGVDLLIIVHRGAAELTTDELRAELDGALAPIDRLSRRLDRPRRRKPRGERTD